MPEIGATVLFVDGTAGKEVEAEVVGVNEDGTINILYPHPYVSGERADAGHVDAGQGVWQWHAKGRKAAAVEVPVAEAPDEQPSVEGGSGATIRRKITSRRSRGVSVD